MTEWAETEAAKLFAKWDDGWGAFDFDLGDLTAVIDRAIHEGEDRERRRERAMLELAKLGQEMNIGYDSCPSDWARDAAIVIATRYGTTKNIDSLPWLLREIFANRAKG